MRTTISGAKTRARFWVLQGPSTPPLSDRCSGCVGAPPHAGSGVAGAGGRLAPWATWCRCAWPPNGWGATVVGCRAFCIGAICRRRDGAPITAGGVDVDALAPLLAARVARRNGGGPSSSTDGDGDGAAFRAVATAIAHDVVTAALADFRAVAQRVAALEDERAALAAERERLRAEVERHARARPPTNNGAPNRRRRWRTSRPALKPGGPETVAPTVAPTRANTGLGVHHPWTTRRAPRPDIPVVMRKTRWGRWESNPHEGCPSAVFETAASAVPPRPPAGRV